MDHLILHDFRCGGPHRNRHSLGYYRPEDLNHHPDWWVERGLKSLRVCLPIWLLPLTSQAMRVIWKFSNDSFKTMRDTNAMIYKIHRGLGSGINRMMKWPSCVITPPLKYTPAGSFRDRMLTSFYAAWRNEAPEGNPFFHFAYASQYTEPGDRPLGKVFTYALR